MKSLKVLFAAMLLCFAGGANSSYLYSGTPFTYAKVSFEFTTYVPGLSSCSELLVDFTGLFKGDLQIVVYGSMRCPAIATVYLAAGSGYVANERFSMSLTVANGWTVACVNLPEATLSGTCSVYNSSGTYQGAALVRFR